MFTFECVVDLLFVESTFLLSKLVRYSNLICEPFGFLVLHSEAVFYEIGSIVLLPLASNAWTQQYSLCYLFE